MVRPVAGGGAGPVLAGLQQVLARPLGAIIAQAVVATAMRRAGLDAARLEKEGVSAALLSELSHGVRCYIRNPADQTQLLADLGRVSPGQQAPPAAPFEVEIDREEAIVDARSRARDLARRQGFENADQVKLATAVSELARNIFRYVGKGVVQVQPLETPRKGVRVVARDNGPGIPNLDDVMSGRYVSKTGLGLGIRACKRLMHEFSIDSGPGGTRVELALYVR